MASFVCTMCMGQCNIQGPISERVAINRTTDINRSSMANRVLRKLAINRNPLRNGAQIVYIDISEKYQRCHRYYPKFPELYSGRINSRIITALKYMTKQ